MGDELFLKQRPIASGNDGDFDNAEQIVQQPRHVGVDRRFALGKRAVQIEHNQLFHSGNSIPARLPGSAVAEYALAMG